MKRTWQILNIITFAMALVANGLIGAQLIGMSAIDAISDKYATLLTPAGYAFSIWSVIYILLTVFVMYQARDVIKPRSTNDLPRRIGPLFAVTNLLNAAWTYVYVSERIGLSVMLLLTLAVLLYTILWRLHIAVANPPAKTIAFVWWPLLVYTGWVTVATVSNIANWLNAIGVEVTALMAIGVLSIVGATLVVLLILRNVRELLLASTWGIGAIGVAQLASSGNRIVAIAAFTIAAVLLLAVVVHGYINRRNSILAKV